MTCYGQINQGNWCQESYESASGDARKRATQLRRAGYRVTVCSLGSQVTGVGLVTMTLVDIRPGTREDTFDLPNVQKAVLR